MTDPRIDQIDRDIIRELLDDGRVSLAELGRRVNLSPPAVAERVRRLEGAGIITGYAAQVDLHQLGYSLTAIVLVKPNTPSEIPKIAELARELPEVGECLRITGEACFYVKLHLRVIGELVELLDRFLVHGQTTTSVINETSVPPRTPPIDSSPNVPSLKVR